MPLFVATISADSAWGIIVACGLLMTAVLVLFLGVWFYRKRILQDDSSSSNAFWTFEDLRNMKDRGELSEEEYQSLRAAMIGAFKGSKAGDRDADAPGIIGSSAKMGSLPADFDVQKGPEG
jgi:hypothetical protein